MPTDYLALFLESRVALGLSSNTVHWYRFMLQRFVHYLEQESLTVATFGPLHFQGFIANLRNNYAPSTVAQCYGAIRTLYRWLVEMELLDKDPTAKLKRPKTPEYFPEVAAREYVAHLLDSIKFYTWVDHRDRTLLELMFCTGLRAGELASLCVPDVDVGRRALAVKGKGSKERVVYFPQDFTVRLWQWLSVHRPPTEYNQLFLSSAQGDVRGPMTKNSVYFILRTRCSKAAAEWKSPHAYRHGFAVDMLRNGASTRLIQKLLGHANITTTEKYLRLVPEQTQAMFDCIWDANPLW